MYSCFGRLAEDVIVKEINKGDNSFNVSSNTIYTTENYKDKDIPIPLDFIGSSATYLEKADVKKGDQVYIEGYFKQVKWVDKVTTLNRYKLVLKVTNIKVPSSTASDTSFTPLGDDDVLNFLEKDNNEEENLPV
jgi:single-stranded DNA-binding protein